MGPSQPACHGTAHTCPCHPWHWLGLTPSLWALAPGAHHCGSLPQIGAHFLCLCVLCQWPTATCSTFGHFIAPASGFPNMHGGSQGLPLWPTWCNGCNCGQPPPPAQPDPCGQSICPIVCWMYVCVCVCSIPLVGVPSLALAHVFTIRAQLGDGCHATLPHDPYKPCATQSATCAGWLVPKSVPNQWQPAKQKTNSTHQSTSTQWQALPVTAMGYHQTIIGNDTRCLVTTSVHHQPPSGLLSHAMFLGLPSSSHLPQGFLDSGNDWRKMQHTQPHTPPLA